MPDPYRVPGPVAPDPPPPCARGPGPGACSPFAPHPPRFPGSVVLAAVPRPAALGLLGRALTAAATAFLLVASGSLSALTYTVVERQASRAEPPLFQPRAPVAAVAPEARVVESLWRRAEAAAAAGGDVTLARATLPRTAVPAGLDGAALRVVHEASAGAFGLRVVAVEPGSVAALAGLAPGDLITTVNGVDFTAPEDGARAFTSAREARALVAEVWRRGHRVVLRVDWSA
jgi:membrane-associated protease RseP (regulator of RpoE activity)